MPDCRNCGAFVTERYVAVFAPPDVEAENGVRVCPQCDDKIRDTDGTIREARSTRR